MSYDRRGGSPGLTTRRTAVRTYEADETPPPTGADRMSPPLSCPAARAWTRTLPSAVASTGPAMTRLPVASAVSWQRSRFCDPPPTMCTTSDVRVREAFGVGDGPGVAGGEAVQDAPDDGCGVVRQDVAGVADGGADAFGHVVRGDEIGIVGVDLRAAGRQRRGGVEQCRRGPACSPPAAQVRWHSLSSQSPPTLRR